MDPSDPAFMQALGLVFDQEHGWVSPSRKGISSMPFREGQHKQLCLNCTEEFPDRDALEVHLRSCGRTAPLSSGSSNPSAPTPPGPSSKGHPSRTRTRVRTRTRTRNRTVTHGPSQRLSVSVCSLCGRNFDTRQGLAAHARWCKPKLHLSTSSSPGFDWDAWLAALPVSQEYSRGPSVSKHDWARGKLRRRLPTVLPTELGEHIDDMLKGGQSWKVVVKQEERFRSLVHNALMRPLEPPTNPQASSKEPPPCETTAMGA